VRHELYRGLASLRGALASSMKLATDKARTPGREPLKANA
jgi:hypothetical protein